MSRRLGGAITIAVLALAAPAAAEVVHRKDTPQKTVFAWEQGAKIRSAPAGSPDIPPGATKITLRLVSLPGVQMREIFMDKGQRTFAHDNAEDTLFYEISGRRVQIVNEHAKELNVGDGTLHPAGVMHQTSQLVTGAFVEFAMPRAHVPGGEATWATAGATPLVAHAGYGERRFALPEHDMREVRLPKGGSLTGRADAARDIVFYVVNGAAALTLGAVADQVVEGDTVRVPAGEAYAFRSPEGAMLLSAVVQRFPAP